MDDGASAEPERGQSRWPRYDAPADAVAARAQQTAGAD